MTAREQHDEVMAKLSQDALERKLAEPAVAFALHAVACHADMLAALKLIADLELSGVNKAILNTARAAIRKAEGTS